MFHMRSGRTITLVAALLALLCLRCDEGSSCLYCGGEEEPAEETHGDAGASCKRASGLDGPDAPRSSCLSGSALLECSLPGGVTEVCVSQDGEHCPDSDQQEATQCKNRCRAGEYAISCGGVGPVVGDATPPEGCRSQGVTPGGPVQLCCPCL